MIDSLQTPEFARLADYIGLWSLSPEHASSLWHFCHSPTLPQHVQQGAKPLRSSVEFLPVAGGKSIAAIRLNGLLMKSQSSFGGTSTIQARREIRQAAADPEVGGIMLLIDSPGGTVAGTSDLADDVRAARRLKPVWAHADDLMASAAYWVGSQAQRITANSPTALVGSIGTLQVIYDMSQAAEREGVRTLVFRTGPLKGLGTPGAPVTQEQEAHVQSLIEAVQSSFDAAVRKGRGMSAAELATVRHGGVLAASAAVDARLIDGIQPLSKTLAEFAKEMKATGVAASLPAGQQAAEPEDEEDDEEEKPPEDMPAKPDDEDEDEDEDEEEEKAAAKTRGTLPTIRRQLVGLPTLKGR